MPPLVSLWGTHGWKFIHAITFAYDTAPTREERRQMFTFLVSVGSVLPCKRCRRHYNAYIHSHLPSPDAPALRGRHELSSFVVDLHNDVNIRLGRPVVPYAEVRRMYEEESAEFQWVGAALCTTVATVVVFCVLHVVLKRMHSRNAPARARRMCETK